MLHIPRIVPSTKYHLATSNKRLFHVLSPLTSPFVALLSSVDLNTGMAGHVSHMCLRGKWILFQDNAEPGNQIQYAIRVFHCSLWVVTVSVLCPGPARPLPPRAWLKWPVSCLLFHDAISSNPLACNQCFVRTFTTLLYSACCTGISTLLCRVRFKINIYKRTSARLPARRRTWARRRTIVCFRYNNDFRRLHGAGRQAGIGDMLSPHHVMLVWCFKRGFCRCCWWTLE